MLECVIVASHRQQAISPGQAAEALRKTFEELLSLLNGAGVPYSDFIEKDLGDCMYMARLLQ